MSRQSLRKQVRLGLKPLFQPGVPLLVQRRLADFGALITTRPPRETRVRRIDMGGVKADELRSTAPSRGALLYFHGGAFCVGSAFLHRALAARLAIASSTTAYAVEYRLAPEHPWPAAIDDAMCAHVWLLKQGHSPQSIIAAGDSAGAAIALSLALRLRDEGRPLPAALGLISPAIDLTLSGTSMQELADIDPMLNRGWLDKLYGYYVAQHSREKLSPLAADLRGLPPMIIHVGSDEILLSDSQRLAERAKAAGVEAQLHVYEGLWHEFHVHAPQLDEANEAIAEMGGFLRERIVG